MTRHDPSAEVFHEVALTASVLGTSKLKQVLADARKREEVDEKWYRKTIVKACSSAFDISQREILTGKSLGKRTDALKACFSIAKQLLKYSDQQIATLFFDSKNKDRSVIAKYIGFVNKIPRNTKLKIQIDFLQRYDAAMEEVKQKIESHE